MLPLVVRVLAILLLCLGVPGKAHAWEFRLECVPFARALSGVRLFGDAWRWWSQAAGRYGRGPTPQPGSVLSFHSAPQMPLGHVAVVTRVMGPRRIAIDHANWAAPGAITTSAVVLDVSRGNDWSAVRVEIGRGERFGSVYATDGFIYTKGSFGGAREQPELMYVGRALAAAREGPQLASAAPSRAGLSGAPASAARPGLLPWNPVPLAPPMPAFPSAKIGLAASMSPATGVPGGAHGRVF